MTALGNRYGCHVSSSSELTKCVTVHAMLKNPHCLRFMSAKVILLCFFFYRQWWRRSDYEKQRTTKKTNDRPIPDYFSNDMEASKHMGAIGCLRTFDKEISTYRALRVTRARFLWFLRIISVWFNHLFWKQKVLGLFLINN